MSCEKRLLGPVPLRLHFSQSEPSRGHIPAARNLIGQVIAADSLLFALFRHVHVFAFHADRTFRPGYFDAIAPAIAFDEGVIEIREVRKSLAVKPVFSFIQAARRGAYAEVSMTDGSRQQLYIAQRLARQSRGIRPACCRNTLDVAVFTIETKHAKLVAEPFAFEKFAVLQRSSLY